MHATLHRTNGPAPDPAHDDGFVLRLRQVGGPVGLTVRFRPEPPADPSALTVRARARVDRRASRWSRGAGRSGGGSMSSRRSRWWRSDATVGDVAYRELAPPPALHGLAECGWVSAPGPAPLVTHVLPDGCMDLVWTGGRILVAGPDTAPHPARHEPGLPTVGLRFAPGALPHLLGVPAAALRDQRVPLSDLAPRVGPSGRSHPGCEPRPVLLDAVTDVALTLLAAAERTPDPSTRELAARIGAGAGVEATADALGCTSRTLHRRCLAEFGYGPSVLRRVLRFRRASALLYAGVAPAEVAAAAGYADQPHLSREVRALAGVAPRQLASGANRSTPLPSGSSTTA